MVVSLSVEPTPSAPGLILRPWRAEDAGVLVAAHRDPLLRRWLMTHLESEEEARRWVDAQSEGWATGSRFSFAVLECGEGMSDDGRPIGHVVLKKAPSAEASAEVGYWTSAQARGRGVASRALDAVSRWALGPQRVMPLARLDLLHASGNHASCRVAENNGFVLRGVLPPSPPAFPTEGHLHVRTRIGA